MFKDAIQLEKIRRILVIKLRHHGDVLLTSPVFSILKAKIPQAEIDALVYAETAAMLELHPDIQTVYKIERNRRRAGLWAYFRNECLFQRTLRNRQYDLIVHLTEHPRGATIARIARPRWAVARRMPKRGWWWKKAFTHFYSKPGNALRHAVELNLDALRRIGIYPDDHEKKLMLVAGETAEKRINSLLNSFDHGQKAFIHIHPGSRWFFKCWPVEKMARLINLLHEDGHTVILTAAPDATELAMIDAIEQQLSRKAHSLAGQLSLKEMAALSARAQLFIGVDSAPMHIAAAMNTPTVGIFGPSGDKEWGPWMVKHRVVASGKHPCRPCGIDGCGGGKVSDCLIQLPVEQVYQAAKELLNQ